VDTESDIEEESDTEMETTSKQPWQVLKKRKRDKLSPDAPQERTPIQIETQNRYEKLIQPSVADALTYNTNKTPTNSENIIINHKPPPIFIYGVTNYNQMVEYLTTAVKEVQWYNKSQYKHIRFIPKTNQTTPTRQHRVPHLPTKRRKGLQDGHSKSAPPQFQPKP
jgi:hypothetical protein